MFLEIYENSHSGAAFNHDYTNIPVYSPPESIVAEALQQNNVFPAQTPE